MNFKKDKVNKDSDLKEKAAEKKPLKQEATPSTKANSLKEAYPTVESLKIAFKRADDTAKKEIAKLANTDSIDIATIINIWKNA